MPDEDPDEVDARPRVLVVENDEGVRQLLEMVLRQHGFDVKLASTGEEAMCLYRQDHLRIDVVLLDVQMPGMDGPSTLAMLKRINPGIRCCFMSGGTGEYSVEGLLGMGAESFFPKPFENLCSLARHLLELSRDRT